jgi:hypothetical protein
MKGLRDRNVLVTGGGSGIGQPIAARFGRAGANVAIRSLGSREEPRRRRRPRRFSAPTGRRTSRAKRRSWMGARSIRTSAPPGSRSDMSRTPIVDYALLSDCHSAALVSRAGSVDWLCSPRFDSPAVFGRLLDPDAGHWVIRPAQPAPSSRRYVDGSLVLETRFHTGAAEVVLTDLLAVGENAPSGS